MRRMHLNPLFGFVLSGVLLGTRVWAGDGAPSASSQKPPESWQVAGIRAAFGDQREPFVERSPAVKGEALKICVLNGWGAALDRREVAVYLGSPDVVLRFAAIEALAQMGTAGAQQAEEVAALLEDASPVIRGSTAIALAKMGEQGAAFLPRVVALFEDADDNTKLDALGAVSQMNLPKETLVQEEAVFVKENAAKLVVDEEQLQLRRGGGGAWANYFFREPVLRILLAPEQPRELLAREITPMLRETNDAMRIVAADLLGELRAAGAPFAGEVAGLLQNKNSKVRYAAVVALGEIGQAAGTVAGKLVPLLSDEVRIVRCEASVALGNMGHNGVAYVSEIEKLLDDVDGRVCESALTAFDQMGPEAGAWAPQVAALIKNPPRKMQYLPTGLLDGSLVSGEDLRRHAASVLGKMGKAGAAFARDLIGMLQEEDYGSRSAATYGLGLLGREERPVAEAVAASLRNGQPTVREAAADSLGFMGVGAAPFVDDLLALLKDDHREVRRHTSKALAALAKAGVPVAEKASGLLVSDDVDVRCSALDALGAMSNLAAPFADRVAALLKDENVNVRSAASVALSLIQDPVGPLAPDPDAPKEDDSSLFGTAAYALAHLNEESVYGTENLAALFAEEKSSGRFMLPRQSALVEYLDAHGNPGGKLDLQARLLAAVDKMPAADGPRLRAHLRLWAAGNVDMERTVTWLGKPDMEPMPKEGLSAEETRETLSVFLQIWDQTAESGGLRAELTERFAQVAKGISQRPDAETAKILNSLSTKLKDQPGSARDAVESALQR